MAQPLPGMKPRPDQALSLNMKLLSHHELQGFGGIGEGMGMQLAKDGRRILWLAHESAPKNFTAVDVTDPKSLKVVVQTELPHAKVRSNSLDVVGDVMAVAYQTTNTGMKPAGFDLFDIGKPENPKLISHFDASGEHSRGVHAGFTHTVLPLFGRELLIVSDECVHPDGKDWPKLVWVVDVRLESNPVPISTFPMPPVEAFAKNGGRFGAHNLHENLPVPGSWKSEDVIVGTFFGGGVRAFDVSNPYQPQEIAYFVPPAPKLSRAGSIQLNDVYVDDRRLVYTVDRFAGGLYVLEMTI